LFGKLRYPADTPWTKWPADEGRAVREFFAAWWHLVLTQPPEEFGLEAADALCAIAQAEDDLAAYLQIWASDSRLTPASHLANLVVKGSNTIFPKNKLANSFWAERRPQMQQVIQWLRHPDRARAMEASALTFAADPMADQLMLAAEILRAHAS
jgi:hypothetical protein